MAVWCYPQDNMRACVDATTTLLDGLALRCLRGALREPLHLDRGTGCKDYLSGRVASADWENRSRPSMTVEVEIPCPGVPQTIRGRNIDPRHAAPGH